jgi:predicted dehydrogenase
MRGVRGDRSRRTFLRAACGGVVAASAAAELAGRTFAQQGGGGSPIQLPPTEAKTEQQEGPPPEPLPPDERVGVAFVGLGNLTVAQLLPAVARTKRCRVAALVSGSPEKAQRLARAYGVAPKSVYSYADFDRIRDDAGVDVVYVVLPNSMHEEFTVRAAQAGKHVLCEKPMATSPAECERMIAACERAGRKLMVAYRIQYEPNNRRIRTMLREAAYGRAKLIEAVNTQNQGDPTQWRLERALAGGGSLPDLGLYCLNTIRALTGYEPVEVSASIFSTPGDPRFREVEENVAFRLRFADGLLANCMTGYGVHESRRYRVYAETGWYGLDPAFSYTGLRMETSHAEGDVERLETPKIEEKNQFALEMDHFARCVKENRKPHTPGEEGLQDHRIMAAIYESAREGRPVKLQAPAGRDAFRGPEPESD